MFIYLMLLSLGYLVIMGFGSRDESVIFIIGAFWGVAVYWSVNRMIAAYNKRHED